MRQDVRTLFDAANELSIKYMPSTADVRSLIHLYHYTSNVGKEGIVDKEQESVLFKLTKASAFADKNEGTFIFEPFLYAGGCLYDDGKIDENFYLLLKDIDKQWIKDGVNEPWILCLSEEGYSQFMKKRYAPGNGWEIILQASVFDELADAYNDLNSSPTQGRIEFVKI